MDSTPSLAANRELIELRTTLVVDMTEYLEEAGADYGPTEVGECAQILDDHLVALQGAASREAAMGVVETTVRRLNALNARTGGELIETDQREMLAEFIIKAGALMGFNGEHEDVTEQWREW